MKKFWKILNIILDIIVVIGIIVALVFVAKWIGRSGGMIDAGDVLGGLK
jgi:hypothetical protein